MGGEKNSKIGRILPKLPTLPRCIVFSPTAQRGRLQISKVWLINPFETPQNNENLVWLFDLTYYCLFELMNEGTSKLFRLGGNQNCL